MEMKRHYDDAGKVVGVTVNHTGDAPEQNWDRKSVIQWCFDGWMSLSGDTITIRTMDGETLTYQVLRHPGYHCKSTGEPIPISSGALEQFFTEAVAVMAPAEARVWLAKNAKMPTDYTAARTYFCRLNDAQHDKFRAVRAASGNFVAAHTLEG